VKEGEKVQKNFLVVREKKGRKNRKTKTEKKVFVLFITDFFWVF